MKKSENGYTLVELLVTIAISGLVFLIAGTAIYQLSTVSGYGNSRLTAVHEMQNAAHWFNRDGQEAVAATGGQSLILTMADNSRVTYGLTGKSLQRLAGTNALTLAQNITELSYTVQDGLVTMNIKAAISEKLGESVQGTYKVHLLVLP